MKNITMSQTMYALLSILILIIITYLGVYLCYNWDDVNLYKIKKQKHSYSLTIISGGERFNRAYKIDKETGDVWLIIGTQEKKVIVVDDFAK